MENCAEAEISVLPVFVRSCLPKSVARLDESDRISLEFRSIGRSRTPESEIKHFLTKTPALCFFCCCYRGLHFFLGAIGPYRTRRYLSLGLWKRALAGFACWRHAQRSFTMGLDNAQVLSRVQYAGAATGIGVEVPLVQ